MSREDAKKEWNKHNKKCSTMFEKAGGCECINGLDSPRCKATTKEEVLAFIPDECLYKYHEVAYYCYLREGKSVNQTNDSPWITI